MTFLERRAPALVQSPRRRIARRGWLLAIVSVLSVMSMIVAAVCLTP